MTGGWSISRCAALGLGELERSWLGDPHDSALGRPGHQLWKWLGFNMIICLAALYALPNEVLGRAELDNCGWWAKLVYVIVPMMRPTLLNLLVLSFIGKMMMFDLVWIMTGGGPLWSTETVSTYVYKRAFNWNTFDLGYPSAIAVLWFAIILAFVSLMTRFSSARQAGVLRCGRPAIGSCWRISGARRSSSSCCRLHHRHRRAVPLGRRDVAAHHAGDPRDPYALPTRRRIGRSSSDAWTESKYGTYFWNSLHRRGQRRRPAHAHRRDGGALPGPLRFRGNRSCASSSCQRHDPAAPAPHPLAVPDPAAVSGSTTRCRARRWSTSRPSSPMTVYILEGFFAQIPQDLFDAARMDGYSDFEIFWRITLPIGMPAIVHDRDPQFHHPVERVPLRRRAADRGRQAHAAARHHAFHGRHQLDVGMIATGLMIAIAPIILVYAFFSETMIKGMTAGAVR